MANQPHCRFQCRKCGHSFTMRDCGLVRCPVCGHQYVDWLNVREVVNWLVDANILPEYRRITY